MACENVITNVPPAGQAKPANTHQGGGFVRWESCGSWKFWTEDVNANCHGIYGLRSINCIPLIDFLTTPLQVDVDGNGHILYNIGKIFIGSSTDDGSGALLQVAGEINAQSYMVDGVEFAAPSVSPAGLIDLYNINNINNLPIADYLPAGPNGSIQFNENGKFAGDAFLVYDELTHRVGIKPAGLGPQWQLDVGGDINIIDPTYLGYAYRINGIPFAVADPSGSHINLINIGLINGQPPGTGGGGSNPGGVQGNVQFNSGGLFAGSNNLFWDNTNNRLGIGTASPQYPLDVVGNVDATGCYFVNHVPFACVDGSGISLQNITTINGGPIGGSGGTPAAPNTSVQFNNGGSFGGSANLVWNNSTNRLGVGGGIPAYTVDVLGIVNASQCYYVGSLPFACNNGSGGINLTNITNINGAPPGSGGASVSVGDTPPATPANGNLWYDSTDTQLYIWYTDPTSSQWVPVINQCGLIGDAPSDGQTYGRHNGAWSVVTAGGGGQNQTPWLSDIQASGFQLLGASTVSFLFGSTSGSIFASGGGSLQFIGNGNTPIWVRSPSWLQLDSVNTVFTTTASSGLAYKFSTPGSADTLDILTSGFVGINTASPITPLHIYGVTSGTQPLMTLESLTGNFIQHIRGAGTWWVGTGIQSSGNWQVYHQTIGSIIINAQSNTFIGLGNLASPLLGELNVGSNSTSNASRGITSIQNSNSVHGARIGMYKNRGTWAAPAAAQVGDYLGSLEFGGYVSNGNYTTNSSIQGFVTAITSATITSDLLFNTAVGESMRLTSAGHLGIGNANPSALLDAAGCIRSTAFTAPTSGQGLELVFSAGGGYLTAYDRTAGAYLPMSIGGASIAIGGGPGPVTILPSGGNVGIGTSSPDKTLTVNGQIHAELGGNAFTGVWYDSSFGVARWLLGTDGTDIFRLYSTGATTGNVLTVSATGSVGIGTSAPQGRMQIYQGTNRNIVFDSLDNVATMQATNDAVNAWTPMELHASAIYLMGGNVGIGTTNPATALDVPNGIVSCWVLGGESPTSYNACLTVQSDRALPGGPPNNTMSFSFATGTRILSLWITDASGVLHQANIQFS